MTDLEKKESSSDVPFSGLSAEEVKERIAAGKVNAVKEKNGKSYGRIVIDNLCTFFNLVWGIITVFMLILHSYADLNFLVVIIPNILIAIIQECRAKHTVEKLSATTDPRATVVRDGKTVQIPATEIVEGDVMRVEMGGQVLSDAVVLDGIAEVNESMLTGESNAIPKRAGDRILSGSFLVSGGVYARVTSVGADNYVHKIERAAKSYKAPASDLFRDLNRLLRYIALFMIPMSVIMFFSNRRAAGGDVDVAISQTCGSLAGMIPAGIFLLVTVTLTLSVITLAKKRTLVQDMYSIEMLARADVVCLDKTGTVTDGTMCVSELLTLGSMTEEEVGRVLARIEGAAEHLNPTARAIIDRFGSLDDLPVTDRVPFSSERKYTAVTFGDAGTFALGAPHFVPCAVSAQLDEKIAAYAKEGKRVLLLASLDGESSAPLALVAVSDRIRPNAKETIENFQSQGVTVKIISGDHAATVSAIAATVGVKDADKYLSCESVSDEDLVASVEKYAVFGRVTPEQKVLLVRELRKRGHTVAMTGDGVNDTLALKESNCAIAMADGSEMARKISQIVLLDSDFGTLPDVVREGRRCINNVRMSATLFIMKTILTISLSLYAVCMGTLYPFSPKSAMLLETFVIGFASVLLALEPNNKRIEGSFIKSVIFRSIPSAIGMFIPVLTLLLVSKFAGIPGDDAAFNLCNTLAMIAMTSAGFANLVAICVPYTKWRVFVVVSMGALLALSVPGSILIDDMLGFRYVGDSVGLAFLVCGASVAVAFAVQILTALIKRFIKKSKAAGSVIA